MPVLLLSISSQHATSAPLLCAIEHVPQSERVTDFMNGDLALKHGLATSKHQVVEQRALIGHAVRVQGPGHGRISEAERTLRDVFVPRNVHVERLRAIHCDHFFDRGLLDPHLYYGRQYYITAILSTDLCKDSSDRDKSQQPRQADNSLPHPNCIDRSYTRDYTCHRLAACHCMENSPEC